MELAASDKARETKNRVCKPKLLLDCKNEKKKKHLLEQREVQPGRQFKQQPKLCSAKTKGRPFFIQNVSTQIPNSLLMRFANCAAQIKQLWLASIGTNEDTTCSSD